MVCDGAETTIVGQAVHAWRITFENSLGVGHPQGTLETLPKRQTAMIANAPRIEDIVERAGRCGGHSA
jgi:hypothetical protein